MVYSCYICSELKIGELKREIIVSKINEILNKNVSSAVDLTPCARLNVKLRANLHFEEIIKIIKNVKDTSSH